MRVRTQILSPDQMVNFPGGVDNFYMIYDKFKDAQHLMATGQVINNTALDDLEETFELVEKFEVEWGYNFAYFTNTLEFTTTDQTKGWININPPYWTSVSNLENLTSRRADKVTFPMNEIIEYLSEVLQYSDFWSPPDTLMYASDLDCSLQDFFSRIPRHMFNRSDFEAEQVKEILCLAAGNMSPEDFSKNYAFGLLKRELKKLKNIKAC